MDAIRKDSNLRFIRRFCKLIGIWAVDTHIDMYRVWSFICILYNALYVLALLVQLVFSLNVNDLYINLCEVAMFAKMINIWNTRGCISGLLQRMHYADAFQVHPEDPDEVLIVQKGMRKFSKFANFYFWMTIMAVCIGTCNGFGNPRTMAFAASYPFGMTDMSVPWKFWVVFVYQSSIILHACINVCWDNLFMYLVTNVQLQLALLSHRLGKSFQEISTDNARKLSAAFDNFSAIMG